MILYMIRNSIGHVKILFDNVLVALVALVNNDMLKLKLETFKVSNNKIFL